MRAGALERARFARELHDGAVQSLIAVEMQVDVLRRQARNPSSSFPTSSAVFRAVARRSLEAARTHAGDEIARCRFQKAARFSGTRERFQRETGISARFLSELEEIDLPPQVCRELARIVQEGLVNIRKHSHAHTVTGMAECSRMAVDAGDRGRWPRFPFQGRLTQSDLEALGKGPLIIKERVRLIEGELTIESTPGKGPGWRSTSRRNGKLLMDNNDNRYAL